MYISKTMLILPLDACIEIATGSMSFIISETALILQLGACDETGRGVLCF